ncbi:putative YccA/Bax inhibitor family protein [Tamaricihabitans halophyticus]|uniref:Putative YccA/Bax inhibitor family protein n=1 Tax=Tamaricihabitans halophyticus TaxID=1262583 RepID=A0A4R2R1E7_9PSEU|nr:Bax inhibitor-1/YccA family protein [Tamaricihabitans halophyticus]TCP56323.1 putative YccA/Bax inhibitor family protein [Tamaricihabitans halophyticus]
MRATSNPAFRNLPSSGGYAGFDTRSAPGGAQPGYGQTSYGGYGPATGSADRPMTVDDVVIKTGITLAVTFLTGIITAVWAMGRIDAGLSMGPITGAMIGGMIVGLICALVVIFKKTPNPALVLTYAAAEGVFLGAITGVFEAFVARGIALQAIMATGIVFAVMLVVYKTGAVKVTPRLTKWVIGAAVGAAAFMLINLLVGMFTGGSGIGIRDGGPLAIVFSLVVIGIAAFMLLLDFDMADQMIRQQMPQKWAWYAAFGLMTTLVWLYLEILRLLSYLQSD